MRTRLEMSHPRLIRRATGIRTLVVALLLAVLGGSVAADNTPVGTAFTYQGRLTASGAPFTGVASMGFRLYGQFDGGTPLAQLFAEVQFADDGRFTIDLDFGDHFDGSARWLEIEVDGETLHPRQPIMAAPHAMVATTAANVPPKAVFGVFPGITGVGTLEALNVDGNIGIGTSSPQDAIHAVGSQPALRLEHAAGDSYSEIKDGTTQQMRINKVNNLGGVLLDVNPKATNGSSNAQVRFFRETDTTGPKYVQFLRGTNSTSESARIAVDGENSFFQMHGGSMGVGTSSPGAKLGVLDTAGTLLRLNGSGTSSVGAEVTGSNIGVRINTTSTGLALSIPSITGSARAVSLYGISSNDIFRSWNDGSGPAGLFVGLLQATGGSDTSPTGGGYLLIGDESSANISMDTNEIMARNNGSTATLHLNADGGLVHVGQNSGGTGRLVTPVIQITGGSDLSEQFDVATVDDIEPTPGMVVCIDPRNPGKLIPSTKAHDRTVAGVISGANGVKTGMLMGQSESVADGAHAVALTGRVYVMVEAASGGAIEPGDLLTTSDVPGHAMKVTDYAQAQGAIIGKSMTSLEAGERGMVLVLVSLQ